MIVGVASLACVQTEGLSDEQILILKAVPDEEPETGGSWFPDPEEGKVIRKIDDLEAAVRGLPGTSVEIRFQRHQEVHSASFVRKDLSHLGGSYM